MNPAVAPSSVLIADHLNKVSYALRAFALKLTGSPADADDLYQDTTLRIITHADKYAADTNFKAWAVTIMKNVFINEYRKRTRRGQLLDMSQKNNQLNIGEQPVYNGGESGMGYKELLRMVNTLGDDLRVPFWMAYQGYQYDEIAECLQVPLGTIKSRIFFARKKLMSMYNLTQGEQQRA